MRYTLEEKEWLRENYPRLGRRETTNRFNTTFNHSHDERSLAAYCSRSLGLKVDAKVTSALRSKNHRCTCRNVTGRRFYEEQEKEWLIENYPVLGTKEATRQFNERFNHNKSCNSLKRYCSQRLGLSVPKEVTIKIKNYPVGYIRRNCRGVWFVKTENGWENLTHTLLDVPKGHIVFHLDGNSDNNSPENLVAVKNGIQTIARNCNVLSEDANISRVGITWAELYSELKKQRRDKDGK